MKDFNWDQFFFRLTVVLSVVIGLIGVFLDFDSNQFLDSIIFGFLLCGGVWIIYFCIRWIYRGLKIKKG